MENNWDVIIVGGGTAGLSAALMLGRARRRTLVLDDAMPRNRFAAHMHGVLGHEGKAPAELIREGRTEAAGYGVAFEDARVTQVEKGQRGYLVTDAEGTQRTASGVIVSTGLTDVLPDIPGLAERWGVSVLHCPYCHGWEFGDRRLGLLAMSPMDLLRAELLRQWSEDLTVFSAGIPDMDAATRNRLESRGISLVDEPVLGIDGPGQNISVVRTDQGVHPIDALFAGGKMDPHDDFLAPLGLERSEGPMGSFLTVDEFGATSLPGIWAIGNVVSPGLTVPGCMGAGALTGGMVNMYLVGQEFDDALLAQPKRFWENRYSSEDKIWSGNPNATLVDAIEGLPPGRAVDLGCGEGADVLWLAEQGWHATGIDISDTAVRRAQDAALAAGLQDHATFLAEDLSEWNPEEEFDLVTGSFLQSPVELDRIAILRKASELVAPGGRMCIISHAAPPPWATGHQQHDFPDPAEDIRALALGQEWETDLQETRKREVKDPEGNPAILEDSVMVLRKKV
ncbi:FAD-dependent oxidoreductase [Rothia uropygialis]|uniref:FAD-dependent oxidoreductase n=1 Tax=Kocuria sp. 36 TaxID=1415402 RepID=UPI00101D0B85|nr:FAD-dependent oxidoreductase [Kocuria sp. 36]